PFSIYLNPTPTTAIYTLSLHDALPIYLESDNQVRIVHVTGEGDDFSVGTDLEAMHRLANEPSDVQRQDAEALGRVYLAARALMKDRKSTRLNSSHVEISYAVFCLKKKK